MQHEAVKMRQNLEPSGVKLSVKTASLDLRLGSPELAREATEMTTSFFYQAYETSRLKHD